MPEISIIVPVYKVEIYLRECLESILNQSFKSFELILVDDGSPDRCGQICDEYALKDNRIKVIHQENKGLSAARNAGLEIIKGRFVTFIDSDDVVECQFLQKLYIALVEKKASISCCRLREFSKKCDFANEETASEAFSFSGQEAALIQYEYGHGNLITVTAWGKIYSRELFNDMRFPVGRYNEDEAVVPIILCKADKVVACTDYLYGYRIREGSIMQADFSITRYDGIIAIEECIDYFNRQKDEVLIAAARRRMTEMMAHYSLLARKAGIFHDVPEKYRMSRIGAIKKLRDSVPYGVYEYKIAMVYPWLVFIEARVRKLRKMLGLKVKK